MNGKRPRHTLDWNPNIVRQLRPIQEAGEKLRRAALGETGVPDVIAMAQEFTTTYDKARELAGPKMSMAVITPHNMPFLRQYVQK